MGPPQPPRGAARPPPALRPRASPAPLLLSLALLGLLQPASGLADTQCPLSCTCRAGFDQFLQRRAKAVSCSVVSQNDLQAVAQMSPAVEVLRFTDTSVRRVDFFALRRLPALAALDLHACGVQELTGTGKTLPRLRFLDMSANAVHSLQSYAFREFPELTFLNMSGNGLHTIMAFSFTLPRLAVLDLRYNKITFLKPHYFADMPSLQEIYLGYNALSMVPSHVFTRNLKTLDLSNNHIVRLEDSAFEAINITHELNMANNVFRRIPNAALKRIGHTQSIVLDGNNFVSLPAGAVVGLAVYSLSFSYQRNLQIIHRDAFQNLLYLEELHIHNNPSLIYLHPRSLVNVPELKKLDISNNALYTLEPELLESAPNISELQVSNNTFPCHCSLAWLKNSTQEEVFCTETRNDSRISLMDIPENKNTCAPYILPLFSMSVESTIGNNVSFNCRALGTLPMKVIWYTKRGERLFNGKCLGRFCVVDNVLTIYYLHHDDSGSYVCVARNPVTVDTREVSLRVRDIKVNLLPLTVASTFVTLTWNMSNAITNNYMLRYEEVVKGTNSSPESVTFYVGMKMHSYTVHGLKPGMSYIFSLCMKREEYVIVIATTSVKTRAHDFLQSLGIEKSYLSAILVSVFIGVVLATCAGICGIKCYRQRIKLQQQSQMRKSCSGNSGRSILPSSSTHSDMAFITYITLSDETLCPDQSIESNLIGYA